MNDGHTQVLCRECYDPYPLARYRLGYSVCLDCGDAVAREMKWCVTIPYSKGAYQVVNPNDLTQLNPKRTT
jgi:hypothetical protein